MTCFANEYKFRLSMSATWILPILKREELQTNQLDTDCIAHIFSSTYSIEIGRWPIKACCSKLDSLAFDNNRYNLHTDCGVFRGLDKNCGELR